jgi:hypothetical protein
VTVDETSEFEDRGGFGFLDRGHERSSDGPQRVVLDAAVWIGDPQWVIRPIYVVV